MDNTITALKNLYVSLGGTVADVADVSLIPDMINAIAKLNSAIYTLTISYAAIITVTRDGVALANGAKLSKGDLLIISSTTAGLSLLVNGEPFTSGDTYTVQGDVTVSIALGTGVNEQ